jgi:hypothetical protein
MLSEFVFFAAGSDVVSMKCKADRVDGGYVLNGNKMWCTNGPVAQTLVHFFKFYCFFFSMLFALSVFLFDFILEC